MSRGCSPSRWRLSQVDNRMGFCHPHIIPEAVGPQKEPGDLDRAGRQGQYIFPEGGKTGRRRTLPVDGSEWPGSNNEPTLHMKELWRARSSRIILWICTATPLERLRGRRRSAPREDLGPLGERSPTTTHLPSAGTPVPFYGCELTGFAFLKDTRATAP